ncbi:MAG: protein phosphatase 2C domain-containing protein [Bdellovibrionales bacterium]|nr:protein phosphatase 2C domain-containing protein [Bdellovibrionales bacterium]
MTFKIISASVPGSSHLGQGTVLIGKNNQDAHRIHPKLGEDRVWNGGPSPLIAIVSDGVSSAVDSEVGSKLAVRMVSATIAKEFRRAQLALGEAVAQGLKIESDPLPDAFWKRVDNNAYAPFSTLLTVLSSDDVEFRENLKELFIFTTLGLLHTEEYGSWIFGPRGSDGVFAANGKVTVLKPQAGNKPISGCYRFVPNEFQDQPELMDTVVHRYFKPGELQTFLLGTDGVEHLQAAEGKKMPGREERVRPLKDLWEDPEFFSEDSLQLYLRQINTEWTQLKKPSQEEQKAGKQSRLIREPRLLLDDTTIIVGRRISSQQ